MALIVYILVGIGAVASLGVLWFLCVMAWIARGEPSSNGDPERDSGEL